MFNKQELYSQISTDITFSRQWLCKVLASGMWQCIIRQKFNNISDESAASHDQDKQQQATDSSAISVHFY
jgi:hypothetical protein